MKDGCYYPGKERKVVCQDHTIDIVLGCFGETAKEILRNIPNDAKLVSTDHVVDGKEVCVQLTFRVTREVE